MRHARFSEQARVDFHAEVVIKLYDRARAYHLNIYTPTLPARNPSKSLITMKQCLAVLPTHRNTSIDLDTRLTLNWRSNRRLSEKMWPPISHRVLV